MSYIGNSPEVNAFTIGVERFNGTGACTEFTLTRDIDDAKAIEIIVNGVQQDPDNSYSVTNGLITFTEAPSSGTDNIVVTYRAPVVVTFNQASSSQIQSGAIGSTQLADNSVTTNKLASGSVTGVKLGESSVSGNNISIKSINASNTITDVSITGNLIGLTAVSGNNIVDNAIRGNNIVAGQITGNLIASGSIRGNNIVAGQITGNLIGTGAITGNLIGSGAISGNQIGAYAISGNQIGIGAVSANNFAGGGITSNVLSSNLSVSLVRVTETININSTVIGSNSQSGTNVNIDINNCTSYYFTSNTSGNVTFNLRGNTINTFDSSVQIGNTVSVVISLRHNVAAHRSGVNVMIDGGYIRTTVGNPDNQTGNILFYSGNTTANHSVINALESNVIGLSVVKKGANSYVVYMSNTLFGLV